MVINCDDGFVRRDGRACLGAVVLQNRVNFGAIFRTLGREGEKKNQDKSTLENDHKTCERGGGQNRRRIPRRIR